MNIKTSVTSGLVTYIIVYIYAWWNIYRNLKHYNTEGFRVKLLFKMLKER